MNKKSLYAAAIGIIAVGALLGLSGCTGGPVAVKSSSGTKATTTPTPAAQQGTRENPFPVGTAGKYDATSAWTFTFGSTVPDAWAQVSAANQFNEGPPAGSSDVLSSVTMVLVKNSSTVNGADPSSSFEIDYVTKSGNSFSSSENDCGVLPAPEVSEIGTMFGGASATAEICSQVPTADVPGGSWSVRPYSGAAALAFFAGA